MFLIEYAHYVILLFGQKFGCHCKKKKTKQKNKTYSLLMHTLDRRNDNYEKVKNCNKTDYAPSSPPHRIIVCLDAINHNSRYLNNS